MRTAGDGKLMSLRVCLLMCQQVANDLLRWLRQCDEICGCAGLQSAASLLIKPWMGQQRGVEQGASS